MRKILFGMIFLMECIGCDGPSTDQLFSETGGSTPIVNSTSSNCNQSQNSSVSSGDTSSNSNGSVSSGVTSSATGSVQCQPKTTCQSINAECGTIKDDGCGNSVDCGDNCNLPFTCGGGESQFKCGCTPKTCIELQKNCDTTDDGCGGIINCGNCDPEIYQTACGTPRFDPLNPNHLLNAQPNVCGGGCGYFGESLGCPNDHPYQWNCIAIKSDQAPPINGNCLITTDSTGTGSGYSWCCDNQD